MLVTEVQKTFDFFRETYPSETISQILISGGTARMPGLAERIAATFSCPTEVLDPFKTIKVGMDKGLDKVSSLGPSLAVAVGLALRGFDQ
jgi:type IV pilus assembly protein PilM